MRLELTRVGLLAELANHYTTRGALRQYPMDVLYLIAKEIIKLDLKFMYFHFLKDKTLSDIWTRTIKRIDFTPTKFTIKRQVNLIETLTIRLITYPCNSQCIKTKLRLIN